MVYTPNQPNVASHGSWVDMENLREMIDRQTDIDMWARKRCTASTIPFHPSQRWSTTPTHAGFSSRQSNDYTDPIIG